MLANPKHPRMRRLERTAKAVVSIAVALSAWAFLACQKNPPQSQGNDAGGGSPKKKPEPSRSASTASSSAQPSSSTPPSASSAPALDAGPDSTVHEAGTEAASGNKAKKKTKRVRRKWKWRKSPVIDRKEHRHGLPVRDNQIE